MHKRSSFLHSTDWISAALTVSLSLVGLLFIYSATYTQHTPYSLFFIKQAVGVGIGLMIYWLVSIINYRHIMRYGYFAYFVTIGLLLFTLIRGTVGMGAQRWIHLFFFRVQPSELAKLFFPAFTTYYLYNKEDSFVFSFNDFIPLLLALGISFLLILKQPDLGTALIVLFSGYALFWLAGISRRFFLVSACLVTLGAPVGWYVLKPYQKRRIMVFLGYGTSHKERYHIEQSHIAIGSGGLWGKGFLAGTQNRLSFLPESRTDFIFSVICEELGFFGALAILALYILLLLRTLYITQQLSNPFMQLFIFGLLMPIALSALINIGMVIGLLPIVGTPLPLISYGVSNLWATLIALGTIQSMARHRNYLLG